MVERILSKIDRSEVAEEEEKQGALVSEGYSFQVLVLQVFEFIFILRKIRFCPKIYSLNRVNLAIQVLLLLTLCFL